MFYKISVPDWPFDNTLPQPGFYLVTFEKDRITHLVYSNPSSYAVNKIFIDRVENLPKGILELFEEKALEKEKSIASEILEGQVSMSESCLLRLVAVSKVNSQTVKLSEILK